MVITNSVLLSSNNCLVCNGTRPKTASVQLKEEESFRVFCSYMNLDLSPGFNLQELPFCPSCSSRVLNIYELHKQKELLLKLISGQVLTLSSKMILAQAQADPSPFTALRKAAVRSYDVQVSLKRFAPKALGRVKTDVNVEYPQVSELLQFFDCKDFGMNGGSTGGRGGENTPEASPAEEDEIENENENEEPSKRMKKRGMKNNEIKQRLKTKSKGTPWKRPEDLMDGFKFRRLLIGETIIRYKYYRSFFDELGDRYGCCACGSQAPTILQMKKHCREMHGEYIKAAYRNPKRLEEMEVGPNKYSIDGFGFEKEGDLFKCSSCPSQKPCKSWQGVLFHVNFCHRRKTRKDLEFHGVTYSKTGSGYRCDRCGIVMSEEEIKNHKEKYHADLILLQEIKVGPNTYKYGEVAFKRILSRGRVDKKQYRCSCKEICPTLVELFEHIGTCHDGVERPIRIISTPISSHGNGLNKLLRFEIKPNIFKIEGRTFRRITDDEFHCGSCDQVEMDCNRMVDHLREHFPGDSHRNSRKCSIKNNSRTNFEIKPETSDQMTSYRKRTLQKDHTIVEHKIFGEIEDQELQSSLTNEMSEGITDSGGLEGALVNELAFDEEVEQLELNLAEVEDSSEITDPLALIKEDPSETTGSNLIQEDTVGSSPSRFFEEDTVEPEEPSSGTIDAEEADPEVEVPEVHEVSNYRLRARKRKLKIKSEKDSDMECEDAGCTTDSQDPDFEAPEASASEEEDVPEENDAPRRNLNRKRGPSPGRHTKPKDPSDSNGGYYKYQKPSTTPALLRLQLGEDLIRYKYYQLFFDQAPGGGYSCNSCGFQAKSMKEMKKHCLTTHPNYCRERPFRIPATVQELEVAPNKYNFYGNAFEKIDGVFECRSCKDPKPFRNWRSLAVHVNVTHKRKRPNQLEALGLLYTPLKDSYSCDLCGTLLIQDELQGHSLKYHADELTFQDLKVGKNRYSYQGHEFKQVLNFKDSSSSCARSSKCLSCGEIQPTLLKMLDHISEAHGVERIKISVVPIKFASETEFRLMDYQVEENEYKAYGGSFRKIQDFLQCGACEVPKSSLEDMLRHLSWHQNTSRNFNLVAPNKYVLSSNDPTTYGVTRVGDVFKCDLCGFEKRRLQCFKKHFQQNHEARIAITSICDICGKGFPEQAELRQHVQYHHTDTDKTWQCTRCGKSFKNKSNLKCHEKIHLGDASKIHQCEVCGKAFREKGQLQVHMVTHYRNSPGYACVDCGKVFQYEVSLCTHRLLHHVKKGKKEHPCPECGTLFLSKSSIRRHVLVTHRGIKSSEVYRRSQKSKAMSSARKQFKRTKVEEVEDKDESSVS